MFRFSDSWKLGFSLLKRRSDVGHLAFFQGAVQIVLASQWCQGAVKGAGAVRVGCVQGWGAVLFIFKLWFTARAGQCSKIQTFHLLSKRRNITWQALFGVYFNRQR